jgi:hypothetical protein
MAAMTGSSVYRVRVGRLVVDGAPEVRTDLLVLGVREELSALLAAGLPAAEVGRELVIDIDALPYQAGRAVAGALYDRVIGEVGDA